MKKNYTFKLDTDLMDQLSLRAGAEVRSLANFVELIFKAAINTVPASLPVLIIESQDVPKDKVKRNTIKKVKEQPKEAINEDTCKIQVPVEEEPEEVAPLFNSISFQNNIAKWLDASGLWRRAELSWEAIEMGDKKARRQDFANDQEYYLVQSYIEQARKR